MPLVLFYKLGRRPYDYLSVPLRYSCVFSAFDWEAVVRQQSTAAAGMPRSGSQSAFLGEYSAPAVAPTPAPTQEAVPAEPPAAAEPAAPQATPPQPTAAPPK